MNEFGSLDSHTLRLFAETTNDGVWITDQDVKIIFGNETIAALTGYSGDAFLGRTIFDFITEGCRSRAESLFKGDQTNLPRGVKLSLQTKDGSTLSVLSKSAPFSDEHGRLVGFLFMLTDIQAEQALRENRTRIRELYENMPLGYQSLDAEGRFVDVNQTWLDMFGYRREEVIGKAFVDFLPPDQRELFQERFARFKQRGEVRGVEFELLHKDGSYHVITCDGRIGYDHDVTFGRTHCIIKDITARVRAEQALQETNARMHTVLSTIPAFVFMKDKDMNYISANQAFCDQVGVPLDQIEGKSDYDLFSAEEAREYRQNDLFILETGQPLINQLETLTDKNGRTQWVLTNKRPVFNPEGEITSIVGITMDITERKQIESKLKERESDYQRLVRHLQKAREKERSIIAREIHDGVGQALTALKFDLDWLEKRINPDQGALAEKITATTALVDETIDLVRSVSASLRPGMLDDLGLVDALEWQLEGLARRTGLDCQLCANGDRFDLPSALETDLFRIAQEALTNIARHARAEHVILELNVTPEGVEMVIQDDGRGIKAEEISKADSFGLLSMRERVRNWGGKIWIEGDEETGTTITVRIVRSTPGEEA
jgi:PAS domain S-box-containing protein